MQAPTTFLPKKGNYQDLASYKKATVIYDLTFYFAKRFLLKGDRTIDQMVQAARSGKQNIAEGCAAAATSAETELKLINVARASMKELLVDYEDYLRVRGLQQWSFDDERTQKTREFCKKHESSEDFMHDIDQRSDEAIANITITLLHQFDNIIGKYIKHLEVTFVEQGGIREQMTAARLGYRGDQKTRIAELEAENDRLRARIAELEQKLKELMRPMSLMGLIGHIGLMGLMSLIGLIALTSCGGGDEMALTGVVEPVEPPAEVGTVISFSAQESEEQEMSQGARGTNGANGVNRANANTRAATPLSAIATQFTVWGHKNMEYAAGVYDADGTTRQTVFPGYTVTWQDNSAATTTTNTNGWEYVQATPTVQTVKYWDWSAKAYRFFAVTGYTAHEPNGAYGPAGAYKAHEISIAADASDADAMAATPYYSRLWFSTGDPVAYADKQFGRPVTLEFVKPYARVRFIFKYVYPREGIALTYKCFKPTADFDVEPPATPTRIPRKGTVTVIYPLDGTEIQEWYASTPDAVDPKALTAFTEDYDPEDDGKLYTETDNGWYMVLPNPMQGSYKLSVRVNGETKYATVPAEYMRWLPGYSYTYVFKIIDQGGVEIGWVESAVTPWTEMNADWEVYNW